MMERSLKEVVTVTRIRDIVTYDLQWLPLNIETIAIRKKKIVLKLETSTFETRRSFCSKIILRHSE